MRVSNHRTSNHICTRLKQVKLCKDFIISLYLLRVFLLASMGNHLTKGPNSTAKEEWVRAAMTQYRSLRPFVLRNSISLRSWDLITFTLRTARPTAVFQTATLTLSLSSGYPSKRQSMKRVSMRVWKMHTKVWSMCRLTARIKAWTKRAAQWLTSLNLTELKSLLITLPLNLMPLVRAVG